MCNHAVDLSNDETILTERCLLYDIFSKCDRIMQKGTKQGIIKGTYPRFNWTRFMEKNIT